MKSRMKKVRRIMAAALTCVCVMSGSTAAFAITPPLKIDMPEIPDFSKIELPESVKKEIADMVSDLIEDHPVGLTTQVTEARYIHENFFWNPSRLQVKWEPIEEAEKYQIKVTDKSGAETIYETTNGSLFEYGIDCQRGNKVCVRAVSKYGKTGVWSKELVITCNSFHGYGRGK